MLNFFTFTACNTDDEMPTAELKHNIMETAIMQKAEYAFLTTRNLKFFNREKKLMEHFIQTNPSYLEARSFCVLVQCKVPSILGYKDNIKLDIEFVKSYINRSKMPFVFQEVIHRNIYNVIEK